MVGQLVGILRAGWKVLREDGADGSDGRDKAVGRVAATDGGGEVVNDVLPRPRGHLCVDPLVGDDLGMTLGHRDEQQDPGAPGRRVQVLDEELLEGAALGMQMLDTPLELGRCGWRPASGAR